jgi:DNA-binding NtrC family response regulator
MTEESQNDLDKAIVIEDDDDIRQMVRRSLELKGFSVFEARTYDAALDLIKHNGLESRFLLTDNTMRDSQDGPFGKFAHRLEAAYLAVNAKGNVIHISGEKLEGVTHHVQKPFGPFDLWKMIDQIALTQEPILPE